MPFETFHRDDQPDEVRRAADGAIPIVVAETDEGWVSLLDAAALEACAGDVDAMQQAIEAVLRANDLRWPSA